MNGLDANMDEDGRQQPDEDSDGDFQKGGSRYCSDDLDVWH